MTEVITEKYSTVGQRMVAYRQRRSQGILEYGVVTRIHRDRNNPDRSWAELAVLDAAGNRTGEIVALRIKMGHRIRHNADGTIVFDPAWMGSNKVAVQAPQVRLVFRREVRGGRYAVPHGTEAPPADAAYPWAFA